MLKRHPLIPALLAAALLASHLPAQQVEGLREGEWARASEAIFPGAIPTDEADRERYVVTRIVDAASGAPLPGARLGAVAEHIQPYPTQWPPLRSALADEDGWARLRIDDLRGKFDWYFVSAPGHADEAMMETPETTVALLPGVDVPIELRDGFDRPVAGARLGLILGCGHTPDVRSVRTDEKGRAVFRAVEPDRGDLWCQAPGFKGPGDYLYLDAWRAGDPPLVLRLDAGRVAQGVVLDPRGRPAAGVLIGSPHRHRGPWTRSGPEGRFLLAGLDRYDSIGIAPTEQRQAGWFFREVAPPGFEMTLRLPAPGVEAPEPELGARVRVVEQGSGAPVAEQHVWAVRRGDGFTAESTTDEEGWAELELFAGSYTAIADGWLGSHGSARGMLAMRPGAPAEAVLQVPRNPTLRLVRAGFPGGELGAHEENKVSIYLVTPAGEREISDEVEEGEPIPVPASGPYRFRLESSYRQRVVPGPAERRAAQPLVLHWFRPHQVRVRLVDPDGRPAAGRAMIRPDSYWEEQRAPAGAAAQWTLPTYCGGGRFYLIARPVDGADLQEAVMELDLPPGEGRAIDAGTLAFGRADVPLVQIVRGDGHPAAGAEIELSAGSVTISCDADEQGIVSARVIPMEGARIAVADPQDRRLPFATHLSGPRPWKLVWPDGGLCLAVRDERDQPITRFTLLVEGRLVDGSGERFEVRGLGPGRHRAVVVAPGRKAAILSLELARDEVRELRIRLDPRSN